MNLNMTLWQQIYINFGVLFITMYYYRGFLDGAVLYQINNSAYKKRKKNQSFQEWLLFSRFKEEIPRVFMLLYYTIWILHLLGFVLSLFFYFINFSAKFGSVTVFIIIGFDSISMLAIALLFWSSKPGYKYSRWIKKRRGQPPKDRKK